MKKISSIIIAFLLVVYSGILMGCTPKDPLVIKESDTYIVIKASSEQMKITKDTTLLEYMNSLKEDGELEFEVENGMICSVNGIENPSDYSSCWMLYTSDEENANSAWGTVEYEGELYGSATYGAEMLKIKDGCLYIWLYQSF